jgi:hypothetical protein
MRALQFVFIMLRRLRRRTCSGCRCKSAHRESSSDSVSDTPFHECGGRLDAKNVLSARQDGKPAIALHVQGRWAYLNLILLRILTPLGRQVGRKLGSKQLPGSSMLRQR